MRSKNILITGGGGFIGSNLIRELIRKKYSVSVIWKSSSDPSRIKDIIPKIRLYNVSLFDKKILEKTLLEINPCAIFHLATYSSYRNQDKVEEMIKVNIKGTLNILQASKNIPYKVFVNTGSSSEYGIKNRPMKEGDLLEPSSFYAFTKSSITLLCQVFSKEYKKSIVTFRPFSVYGPYEGKGRFIPTIMTSLIKNEPILLTSGSQRRDFIYVEDVVDAYIKTLDNKIKFSGEIINIGTGKEYTNDEVTKTLFNISKKRVKIVKGGFLPRVWDTPHWVANPLLSKKILKWEAKNSLEKGLLKTYNWYLKNYEMHETK